MTPPPVDASSPSSTRRKKPTHQKLNPKRVAQLAAAGMSTYEIARTQGVNQSSVHRFLKTHEIEKKQVETYRLNRADLLANTGSKLHGLISAVAQSLDDDVRNGIVAALSPDVKGKLARDLSVVQGVIYDKERLERGQSTENHSVMHRILGSAFDGVHNHAKENGSPDAEK